MTKDTKERTKEGTKERTKEGRKSVSYLLSFLPSCLLIFLLGLALLVLSSCSRTSKPQAAPARPAVPVSAAVALETTVPVQVQAVGAVQAYHTVAVQAQVNGQLLTVHFQNGQYVKAGDLLFSLDARPFQAQLDQARANRAKDQAQLRNARAELQRNAAVIEKGYVSHEQYDQAVATAATAEATLTADTAAIEAAQLQVEYCSIRSPLDGRAGAVLIDAGNVVKANDTTNPMVVLNQIQPIYVAFYVPQGYLPQISKYMALGKLSVEANVPGSEQSFPHGELTFIDNAINASAGTIQLRATFPNQDRLLWPGQFVNTVLTITSLVDIVTIPSQAVQSGQKGQYVFVVSSAGTAEFRSVTVSRTVKDQSVIAAGVRPGETVVTDGQLRLADGAPVRIVESLATAEDQGP